MSRTIVINEIISELEKITGDENIKRNMMKVLK